MPLLATFGDGVTTTFRLPVHDQQATATVGGSGAAIASQDPFSVTFTVAPALSAAVVISYNPQWQSQGNKGAIVVGQSAIASAITGVSTETTLGSVVIPGGMLGPNGSVRVIPFFSCTNSANTKTVRVRLGGTQLSTLALTTSGTVQLMCVTRNRGVTNSQTTALSLGLATSVNTPVATAIDTSVPQVLTLTGQLATTTETITLEGYTVEVLNP